MKTITNTLLIAAIFTSTLVASQPCTTGDCFASFGKKTTPSNADYKVTSFKQNNTNIQEEISVKIIIPVAFQKKSTVIATQDEPIVETTIIIPKGFSQEVASSEESEVIIVEESISQEALSPLEENNNQSLLTLNQNINEVKTICKENNELVSCDTINEYTECTC